MIGLTNKVLEDAVAGLIREGLLVLPSFGWGKVKEWIAANYPEGFHSRDEYVGYINSEEWAKERERQFGIHGRECEICGGTTGLQVHHISYENGRFPNEFDCAVLCRDCHERLHATIEKVRPDILLLNSKKMKWHQDVDDKLAHRIAQFINGEWPYGIPGKRKVRAVAIIRGTFLQQVSEEYRPNHMIIAKDLIKGRK